eukprot:CAMPEP_0202972276 /NCGR_PEP_ID=MMETSP1396-20130829/34984_1 /ASSEMBLY_ACC=CAM_ASM_000872 /TAXON_ID= /ORGANISM="Pseudokeronopsis sp., Strain Brazil" /LENGTH=95 /DNA_ID=CAMNT_0049702517 /DNA_START=108 /DNA_END=392 /DNA_ORIENTATION=+
MSSLATTLDELRQRLYVDSPAPLKNAFKIIEEKLKINIEYIVLGFAVLLCILVFAGVGGGLISALVGILYPTYASIATLESEKGSKSSASWLTYW